MKIYKTGAIFIKCINTKLKKSTETRGSGEIYKHIRLINLTGPPLLRS
jgi:hypothetical protein